MLYAIKGLDLGSQIYKRYSDTESTVSFAGHFVGFVAGITFGCYILKNVESRKGELYVTPMRDGQSALLSVLSSRQGARLPLCPKYADNCALYWWRHHIPPRYIRWGSISVFVTGLFFAIFWNVFFTYDPKGLCESESTAKCDGDYLVAADIASTPAPGRF